MTSTSNHFKLPAALHTQCCSLGLTRTEEIMAAGDSRENTRHCSVKIRCGVLLSSCYSTHLCSPCACAAACCGRCLW